MRLSFEFRRRVRVTFCAVVMSQRCQTDIIVNTMERNNATLRRPNTRTRSVWKKLYYKIEITMRSQCPYEFKYTIFHIDNNKNLQQIFQLTQIINNKKRSCLPDAHNQNTQNQLVCSFYYKLTKK